MKSRYTELILLEAIMITINSRQTKYQINVPMALAVSSESPVSILMETPPSIRVRMASLTPSLGGSMIPTMPTYTRLFISGP